MKNRKEINMNSPIDSKTNKPVIISFIKLLMTEAQLNKLDELTEEEELIFLEKLIEEFFKKNTPENNDTITRFIELLMTEAQLKEFDGKEDKLSYLNKRIQNFSNKIKSTNILNETINKIDLKEDEDKDEKIIINFIKLFITEEQLKKFQELNKESKLYFLDKLMQVFFIKSQISSELIIKLIENKHTDLCAPKNPPRKKWKI